MARTRVLIPYHGVVGSAETPSDGELFLDTATYTVYIGNGGTWHAAGGSTYTADEDTLTLTGGEFSVKDVELLALAGLTSAANKVPRFTGSGTADLLDFDTDATLAANSATRIPSQSAVKAYVDALVNGLSWKESVRAATTAPGTLASSFDDGNVIDGVTLAAGDRILIKDQSDATENGIYVVAAMGAPSRASDADAGDELLGAVVAVREGSTNADARFICTNDGITLGSTSIAFTDLGGGVYSADEDTLTLTGSEFSIASPNLLGIHALTVAADKGIYYTASNGAAATFTLTSAARNLLDDTTFAAMRATLDLEPGVDVQAFDAELTVLAGLTFAANKVILLTGAGSATVGAITNDYVDAAAAIAWSKISKTGSSLADLATRSAGDLNSGTLPDARLSDVGTAGTYAKVTTDAKGRVSSGATLSSTDLPQRHNLLANGGAWFWQRQTPGTLTTRLGDQYCADRWYTLTQTTSIQTARTTGNTGPYAIQLKQHQVAAQRMGVAQIVENLNSHPMRGRTLRLQFNAKCSTTTTLRFAILEWTGTADTVTSVVVNDWTSGTYTAGNFFLASSVTVAGVGSLSVGTSYTACSLSATISASCNNLIVFVWTEGTAAQNVTVELAEVMLCDADLSRAWLPQPLSEELLRCQRFYQKSYAVDTAPATATSVGAVGYYAAGTNGEWAPNVTYVQEMRATPTLVFYSTATGTAARRRNASDGTDEAVTTPNLSGPKSHTGFSGSHTANKVYHYQFTAEAEL